MNQKHIKKFQNSVAPIFEKILNDPSKKNVPLKDWGFFSISDGVLIGWLSKEIPLFIAAFCTLPAPAFKGQCCHCAQVGHHWLKDVRIISFLMLPGKSICCHPHVYR